MGKLELVLIGDVIKSRKNFNPKQWNYFHQLITKINDEFSSEIKVPLTIYSGDSFGGVCLSLASAINIVLAIQELQKYHNSRVVLIEDKISFGLDTNNFLSLEGPALWKSGDMLKKLKNNSSFFFADLQSELKTITVNTILNLILSIRNDWNEMEWEVYKFEKQNITQKEIAVRLGVSQQYVSKIINNSKLKLVNTTVKNLKKIINGIDSNIFRD
ncbi:MAG: SatD family protein [Bacteroidota bacterium]